MTSSQSLKILSRVITIIIDGIIDETQVTTRMLAGSAGFGEEP